MWEVIGRPYRAFKGYNQHLELRSEIHVINVTNHCTNEPVQRCDPVTTFWFVGLGMSSELVHAFLPMFAWLNRTYPYSLNPRFP